MSRVVSVLAISLVLGACASSPQPERPKEKPLAQPEAPAATTTAVAPTACSVYVYRNKTTFHSANPELPFLYVGDVKVGRLAIGESRCLRLAPGKHTISVKEPFMFMPSYTSGAVDVHVIAGGAPFYVRY